MWDRPGRDDTKLEESASSFNSFPSPSQMLIAGLALVAGGGAAFVLWTLPEFTYFSSHSASLQDYLIALLPIILVLLILLLGCVVWWMTGHARPKKQGTEKVRGRRILLRSRESLPISELGLAASPSSPHHMPLHSSATERQKRRTKRLYAGREYKGKTHQMDLPLSNPVIPSVPPMSSVHSATSQPPHPAPSDKRAVPAHNAGEEHILVGTNGSKPATSHVEIGIPSPESGTSVSVIEHVQHTDYIENSENSENSEHVEHAEPSPDHPEKEQPTKPVEARPPVTIYLLNDLVVEVQNAEGSKRTVPLQRRRREDGRYIERELLAYLAVRRGEAVSRDELLVQVFGYDPSQGQESLNNLVNQFNRYTQHLRRDMNKVAAELGLSPLTIIRSKHNKWHLVLEECRVIDPEEVK